MIIEISKQGGASLLDAANFNGAKVVVAAGSDAASAEAELGAIGRVDGDHVWVDPQWLRDHGPGTPEWNHGFEAMLRFADGKGWLDSAGSVRVHIERN